MRAKSIDRKQVEIIEELELFDEWIDKYNHIIEMGRTHESLREDEKSDVNLVSGCQSKVWLLGEYSEGKMQYRADSDALIPKGIIALLLRVYNGESAEDVISSDLTLMKETGLETHLSPNRANGMFSMIQEMKRLAAKFLNQ